MKILIVDDEVTARAKMQVLLNSYGECSLATSAQQALQLCESAIRNKTPYNLITIDIHIGDADGNELLKEINQLELKEMVSAAKKIMITASGTKDNLIKAYSQGCDGFLVKPVKQMAMEQKLTSLGVLKQTPVA